ncbi:MAG: ABC transporter substrate binding protein [Elusimicrobiota bacterium]
MRRALPGFCCAVLFAGMARGQEVVAVLGSDIRPYQDAFESFKKELGIPVQSIIAQGDAVALPRGTRIVAAFGSRAAQVKYPSHIQLVYGMAPAGGVRDDRYDHPPVQVEMSPRMEDILQRLLSLQPSLRRLAVLWSSPARADEAGQFQTAASGKMTVLSIRIRDVSELSDKLREIKGSADAIWLLADPFLITADNFDIIKQFSWSNSLPFYCPTEGLVNKGATASISSSYQEIGKTLAVVVRDIQAGVDSPAQVFPAGMQVSLSRASAERTGLKVSDQELGRVEKLKP